MKRDALAMRLERERGMEKQQTLAIFEQERMRRSSAALMRLELLTGQENSQHDQRRAEENHARQLDEKQQAENERVADAVALREYLENLETLRREEAEERDRSRDGYEVLR